MAPDGDRLSQPLGCKALPYGFMTRGASVRFPLLEGNAAYPKFAPTGKKLCYRIVKAVPRLVGTNRDPAKCGWRTWTPGILTPDARLSVA